MAVSLYTGLVGAGKSYEVVKSVILPALAAGRPVVANIEGLDREAILEWLEKQGCDSPGDLLVVDRLEVRRADFFPERQPDGSYKPSAWVPLGALVVVDECPFYWGSDKSILPAHLAFFREHRHVTSADGTACDLVLVSQTVDAVHRSLKGLVEFSVDCRKLSALGLSKKYTTVTYSGAKRSGKYVMGRATQTYDPKIFPLYKSFAHGSGKILRTDARFTIWSSKAFWFVVCIAPVLFGGSLWMLYHQFFGSHPAAVPAAAIAAPGKPADPSALVRSVPPPPPPPRVPSSGATEESNIGGETVGPVSVWHIVGQAAFGGHSYAVIRRPGFPLRYMPIEACRQSYGVPFTCRVGPEVFEPEASTSPGSAGSSPAPSTWGPDVAASAVRPVSK